MTTEPNHRPFTAAGFQQYLQEGQLMGARCQDCGQVHLPPREICPHCFSDQIAWETLSGEGRLAAFTVIHIAPTHMIEAGYGRDNPYCSGIVRLNDGPAISAQIVGVDVTKPETIQIDTLLKAVFVERGEGEEKRTYLAFEVFD